MQQKQQGQRLGIFLLAISVVLVGALIALMRIDIPAPQQAIEKELDAKTFAGDGK